MRLLSIALLAAGLLPAQEGPRIGIIDFYGLRKVSEKQIRKALGVSEGDFLPRSKGDVEDRLDTIPGIVESHLEATCCEDGKVILYVGVEEKGSPHFELRNEPDQDILLPGEIEEAYHEFLSAVNEAVRKGETEEDLTRGHSLMANATARSKQERFASLADQYLKELREVLRGSADEEQRAIAAYVIGYAPDKAKVVDDLQYALRDADETVRSNATRAMGALAVLAHRDPDSGIKIEPTWFIEMLNSIIWTDRHYAATTLVNLTESRNPSALDQLRERALPSLAEMARWKQLAHALPAYILLGRVAGFTEKDIQDAWSRGDRESIIQAALKKKKGSGLSDR